MILLIDNNDSFTYNVVQLIENACNQTIRVRPAKQMHVDEAAHADYIIFSPGPGLPNDFPILKQILEKYDSSKPILGICLGHQAICEYYGGELTNMTNVAHGVPADIICDPSSLLFRGIDSLIVGRYHSWVAHTLPASLRPTAVDKEGLVMAVEHTSKRVYGVQFHPESYITKHGQLIIQNFLDGIS